MHAALHINTQVIPATKVYNKDNIKTTFEHSHKYVFQNATVLGIFCSVVKNSPQLFTAVSVEKRN